MGHCKRKCTFETRIYKDKVLVKFIQPLLHSPAVLQNFKCCNFSVDFFIDINVPK